MEDYCGGEVVDKFGSNRHGITFPPKFGSIDATANPDTPKPATHNELQPRLVALREKLPTLHTLLVYSDVF